MEKVKRNLALDVARGGAILIVIFGHVVQVCYSIADLPIYYKIIRTFQMPLFYIIAGFAYGYTSHRPIAKQLLDKIKRLLIPYICWIVLLGLPIEGWRGWTIFLTHDFWFLRKLFLLFVLYAPISYGEKFIQRKFSTNIYYWYLMSVFILSIVIYLSVAHLGVLMWFLIGRLAFISPFSCGAGFKSAAKGLLSVGTIWTFLTYSSFSGLRIYNIILVSSVCCCIFIMSSWISKCEQLLTKILVYMGRRSLSLYAIHWWLLYKIVNSGCRFAKIEQGTNIIVCFIAWVVGALLVDAIISKWKISAMLFCGDKINKEAKGLVG